MILPRQAWDKHRENNPERTPLMQASTPAPTLAKGRLQVRRFWNDDGNFALIKRFGCKIHVEFCQDKLGLLATS
jgi:hypothetical protein